MTNGFQWRFFSCRADIVYEFVMYELRDDSEESQRRIVSVIAHLLTSTPEEWLRAPSDTTDQSSC